MHKLIYIPISKVTIKRINVLCMDVCQRDARKSRSYEKYRKYVRSYREDTRRRRRYSRFVYFDSHFHFHAKDHYSPNTARFYLSIRASTDIRSSVDRFHPILHLYLRMYIYVPT